MASSRIVIFPQAKIDTLVAKGDALTLATQLSEVQRSHTRLVEANASLGKALEETHRTSTAETARLCEEIKALRGETY
jgi:hypothetical protein